MMVVDCLISKWLCFNISILRLQECLSKYERSNDESTPQMNQLQTELRLARSLIAERDSKIQRVHTTNNQYVEENERLRDILGEWSTRAAKLERMSNLEVHKKLSTSRNQTDRINRTK